MKRTIKFLILTLLQTTLQASVLSDTAKLAKELIPTYKKLHEDPELSFFEKKTADILAQKLKETGMEVTSNVGGFGVVGVYKNGPGKTVLVRTDLDALPVEEKTGLEYASKKKVTIPTGGEVSVMHACGHDLHIANLIGTVQNLVKNKSEWKGTLVVIGQPAEEKGQGAVLMLKDGLFTKFPKPDYALAFHVDSAMEVGKVGYISGPAMAEANSIDIQIKGKGGHGAMPHTTVDPVVIASQFVMDIQSLMSRERNPIEASVITVGSFHCGTKHNIISDECRLQLTVRTFNELEKKRIYEGIKRKAKAAAEGAGAPEPVLEFSSDATPALVNDAALVARLVPVLKASLGEKNVEEAEKAMVSEDFARYGLAGVPVAMFRLGTVSEKRLKKLKIENNLPSLHSGYYYPEAEESLKTGIHAMSQMVVALLKPN